MNAGRISTILITVCALAAGSFAQQRKSAGSGEWKIPVAIKKLSNGLTVIVSEDHSVPTFGMNLSYGIGFRYEPRDRSGFAHLFEHMMFEGTPRAKKGVMGEVIRGGGGWSNADTRADYTEYVDAAPISALDPVLWLEADRMTTLDFSPVTLDNQRKVVEEELRGSVLNRPYQFFYVFDLPMKAFDKFPNAHNFIGDFQTLDAATVADVRSFYEQYYAPNNAVLAIVGDVDANDAFAKVEKYFGGIPARPVPKPPDVSEPPQTAERRAVQPEKLAKTPALAIGYRMPPATSAEAIVGALTGALLDDGTASRLNRKLVQEKKVASDLSGGVNWPLGTPFAYGGPTLMTTLIHYPLAVSADTVLGDYDEAIADLVSNGVPPAELERTKTKLLSTWYGELDQPVNRATALAYAQMFFGDAGHVNDVAREIAGITSAEIQAFASKYLRSTNRTVLIREPAKPEAHAGQGGK